MECLKSYHKSPEESKLRFEYGDKMEAKCPNCDKPLPFRKKFFKEYGQSGKFKNGPTDLRQFIRKMKMSMEE